MTTTADHTKLVTDTRLALGRHPGLTLWLNAKVTYINGEPRAKPGLGKGSSDLVGILNGRFIALEAKTGNATTTREQRMFIALVRKRGGFAAVFRSVEEAQDAIARAEAGANE